MKQIKQAILKRKSWVIVLFVVFFSQAVTTFSLPPSNAYVSRAAADAPSVQQLVTSPVRVISDDTSAAPTCEGTAGPLGWMLCSVFNLVGNASQWILQNIIQPFLTSAPISTDPSDPGYKIWSNFRVYGDIFLIIALLVVVFGESIGGGLIDAYTVKKVLPRLLAAAILINLSIYIIALLVDLTNVVGAGISNIITQPLRDAGAWHFKISGGQIAGVFGVGLIGLLATLGSIVGFLGAIFFGGLAGAGAAITAAFFVGLPMILALVAVFITLVIRKGILLILLLVSPVAFALYCLPNTEQYFRKWWDALLKTLLVYPIVMLIFAVADVLSVSILSANGITATDVQNSHWIAGHTSSILAIVIAFVAQFLPLFFIPFSFRLAGGFLGRMHEVVTGAGAKLNDMTKNRTEQAKQDYRSHALQSRERAYNNLNSFGDRNRSVRGISRFLARRAGGYNPAGATAAHRAEVMKQMQAQNDTGDDTEQRALSVNKQWADEMRRRGIGEGTHWRDRDGKRQYRTMGGAWVNESDVDSAHARWGGDQAALQWSIGHEMEKASTQEEQDYLRNQFGTVVSGGPEGIGGWGMSDGEVTGLWKGAAFSKQNVNRQWKHYGWQNGDLQMGGEQSLSLFREIDEKQGGYAMLQQSADTWTTMSQAMQGAQARLSAGGGTAEQNAIDQEILERGARIAHATREASAAGTVVPGDDGAPPQNVQPGVAGRRVGAGAAGRVQEEMERFVLMSDSTAGRYRPPEMTGNAAPPQPVAGDQNTSLDRRGTDRPDVPGGGSNARIN